MATHITRSRPGIALAALMMLALGCDARPAELAAASAATQPVRDSSPQPAMESSDQTTPPAPGPIPARAMLGLDELTPKIEPPKGKPEDQPLPERVRDEVAQAEALIAQRSFDKAVTLLERSVSFAPANARILRLLGQAYASMPNRGKAEANLLLAVKAAGDDLESHLMLGQLAAAGQQNDQAIEHIRTALLCSQAGPQNPRAAEAILTLALLLDREGYWSAAMEAYAMFGNWADQNGRDYADRATLREWVLRPERLLSRQGALLILLRRTGEAITLLDRAYRRDRTSGRTASLLVDALLSQKQYDKVEAMLLDMVDLPSQRGNLPTMLGSLCRQSKDRKLPERFWQAVAQRHKQDADIAIALARAAQQFGWSDEAMTILQSVATAQPNNADLWRILGSNYARQGWYEQLLALMDKSLAGDPASVDAMGESIPDIATAANSPDIERTLAELARKSDSKNQFALLYLAGRFAAAKGKELLAADLYQRATEKQPDFHPAYVALLESYIAQKRDDLVDRLLARMTAVAKDTYLPYYLRGKVAMSRGKAADAIEPLLEARRLKKDDLPVVLILADAYAAAGRQDDAIATLLYALREQPNSDPAARKLFDIYVANRDMDNARQLVAQLQRRNPDNFQTRLMLAELALYSGRRKEAVILLNQLASIAPMDADVLTLCVRALLGGTPGIVSKKEFDDAAEKLNRLIQAQPANRPARKALADLLSAVDMTAEAAALYGTLLDEAPSDKDLARSYVDALADANQPAAALSAVEKFRSAANLEEDIWGRVRLIELLGKIRQFERADKLVEQWISQTQNDTLQMLYRQTLLQVMQDNKQYSQAVRIVDALAAASAEDRYLRYLRLVRLDLLGMAGQYDEALAMVRKNSATDPMNDDVLILALAAMRRKDYDKSIELLDQSIKELRTFADILAGLGKAVTGLQLAKATTGPAYAEAIKRIPEAVASLIAGHVSGARYDQAIAIIDSLAQAADKIVWGRRQLHLVALDEAQRKQDARKLAEKWVADFPNNIEARRLLIARLTEAKQLDQALKLANESIAAEPKNIDLLTLKSTILGEMGKSDEAMTTLAGALAIQPTDEGLNNNMGYLLAVRGQRLGEAEKMLRLAVRLKPETTAYADSLAWVFYKQGRQRMAGRVFQRLLARPDTDDPGHGVIFDHAGDAYWRLGWRDKAAKLWARALELGRKVENPMREDRELLENTPRKIDAARKGLQPKVSPLGDSTMPDEDDVPEEMPTEQSLPGFGQ